MPDDLKTKLYRRIVHASNDEFLLERMRLYGFWPEYMELPQDPPDELEERQSIEKMIAELRQQHASLGDPHKALAVERQRRWEESKKRRAAKKKQKLEEAQQRRQKYESYRETTIVHSGEGLSSGLNFAASDRDLLTKNLLPIMHRSEDLAHLMGIPLSTLRWLTFHRRGATIVHYHRYDICKKTGGLRSISAPKPALANAQRWVLENILAHCQPTEFAHGFVPRRSIVSNAHPHVGKQVVINVDIKDFFPSITFRRVKGLFHSLGYSEHLSVTLALLCTEPPRIATTFDGQTFYVALGDRILPQGACTSPAITNAICRRMDFRLAGLARKHSFTYSRYADDLTFSGDDQRAIGKILKSVHGIVEDEGFSLHPKKTNVMRASRRQQVTGVIVNEKPSTARKEYRRLRALLHNAKSTGLAAQNRDGRPGFASYLNGRIAFIAMVDAERGKKLRKVLDAV